MTPSPDHLAERILRSLDAAIGANVDRRMAKQMRREYRDGDTGMRIPRHQDHAIGKLQLGNVEFLVAEGALEDIAQQIVSQPAICTVSSNNARMWP